MSTLIHFVIIAIPLLLTIAALKRTRRRWPALSRFQKTGAAVLVVISLLWLLFSLVLVIAIS